MMRNAGVTAVFFIWCFLSAAAPAPAVEPGQLLIRTSTMLGQGIPLEDREKLSVAVSADGLN